MSLVSHWVVDNFLTFIYVCLFCLSALFYICVLEKTTLNLNCFKKDKIMYIEILPLSDLHVGDASFMSRRVRTDTLTQQSQASATFTRKR